MDARAGTDGGGGPAERPATGRPRADGGGDGGIALVLALMGLYAAVHVGFRLAASWSLGEDDPIENILVQELRAIYDPRQPPLYGWVLYAVQQVTGPTIVSFLAIKYAALIATGAFIYAIARHAVGNGVLALLAVESLALIYQLSWRFHEGFTHQVGAMVAVVATTWAALRVLRRGRTGDFLLLGVIAGLGTLTEPIFAVFLAALLGAVALEAEARRRLFEPRLALAALPVAACAGFYLWQALSVLSVAELAGMKALPPWRGVLSGLYNAARAPLFYLSPLILILPFVFPGVASRVARDLSGVIGLAPLPAAGDAEPGLVERIVLRTAVIGCAISVAGAGALGLKGYPSHVYMPLYITSVVWLMGAARRTGPSAAALNAFARVALVLTVVALVARLANMFVLDPVCKICRWGIPYDGLAAEMRAAGLEGATIVTMDHELGGNLRAQLPSSRIVLHRGVDVVPKKGVPVDRGRLVLVWSAAAAEKEVLAAFRPLVGSAAEIARAQRVQVPWRHLWRPDGYRSSVWRILTIDRGG